MFYRHYFSPWFQHITRHWGRTRSQWNTPITNYSPIMTMMMPVIYWVKTRIP